MSKNKKNDMDEVIDDDVLKQKHEKNTDSMMVDLEKFDFHIDKNESLYNEIHNILKEYKSNSVKMTNAGLRFRVNLKDFAELGRTLSSIRSAQVTALTSKINARKSLADLKLKEKGNEEMNEGLSEVSRNIINAIHSEASNKNKEDNKELEVEEEKLLDEYIEKASKSGKVNLSKNEKAMIEDFKGINVFYDLDENEYVVTNNEGEIIDDYPTERLVEYGTFKSDKGDHILTSTGKKVKKYNLK